MVICYLNKTVNCIDLQCSRTCGKGLKYVSSICVDEDEKSVDDKFCKLAERLPPRIEPCFSQPCYCKYNNVYGYSFTLYLKENVCDLQSATVLPKLQYH